MKLIDKWNQDENQINIIKSDKKIIIKKLKKLKE